MTIEQAKLTLDAIKATSDSGQVHRAINMAMAALMMANEEDLEDCVRDLENRPKLEIQFAQPEFEKRSFYAPCQHCVNRKGNGYWEGCDKFCDYAKSCRIEKDRIVEWLKKREAEISGMIVTDDLETTMRVSNLMDAYRTVIEDLEGKI